MVEFRKRTLCKTISWRCLATFTTMLIVYFFTGELALSVGVGIVEVISKMIFYYFHERIWARYSWGKVKHPLSELKLKKKLDDDDMNIIKKELKNLGYM